MRTHVLSVGQCSADDMRLAHALNVEADAHLDRAHTVADAQRMMAEKAYDLVLVNRVFDADGHSGLEFIAELKKAGQTPCAMLISDYPEAQAAARKHGAKAGFGKSALGTPEVGQLLRQALHSCSRAGQENVAVPAKAK